MLSARVHLTPEKLFQKVSPYEIFLKYCDNWSMAGYKLNNKFISEFRPEDKDPSAEIKVSKSGNLYYKDYGENIHMSSIDFVMRKFSLNFPGALKKMFTDFDIDKYKLSKDNKQDFKRDPYVPVDIDKLKGPAIIKKKRKEWNNKELKYWNQFAWTSRMLDEARIESLSKYWLNKSEYAVPYEPTFSYEYHESEGIFRRKIYFPNRAKGKRFISNVDRTVVQGYHMLPDKGEILFITKAMKDIGPFKRLNYSAIAPNSESSFLPDCIVKELKQRFRIIIIWFDNDLTGVKYARKFSNDFNMKYIFNPERSSKDPSDFTKDFGLNNFNNYLKTSI